MELLRGIVLSVLMIVVYFTNCHAESVRPLYILGHMANKRGTVDRMLQRGANAIETDLLFDSKTGLATRFYHGIPCDCFRSCREEESPSSLLAYIRDLSTPGHPKFVSKFTGVMWIDIKISKVTANLEEAGKKFADLLVTTFQTPGSHLKLVLAVVDPNHFKFIKGLVEELKRLNKADILSRIGTSGYQNEHFSDYIAANKALGLPPMWLDEGTSNCLSHFFHLTELKKAVKERDEGDGVSKVCRWTVDNKAHMRNALSVGVDSIISNDPEDVVAVLNEPDWQGIYRLATSQDDPFKKVQGHGPYRLGCHYVHKWFGRSYYQCWKDTTLGGSWCYTQRSCGQDRSSCRITDPCK